MPVWHHRRDDVFPLALIALLPILVAVPQLLGWLTADPMLYYGSMATWSKQGILPGYPYIDPNNGVTTQALGYRAALDWIAGQVPWWNPYSGVGLQLAAEYQPAAFFPPVLLLLLPNGLVLQHLLLQTLAGWGTYALLRQLGLGRLAAVTGGVLYSFNGTLAWFDHSSALPVPFLPWMLLGIERARAKPIRGSTAGWRLFALALCMSLLAGFPETAYINGLLVLCWAILRFAQTDHEMRFTFVWRVALGGIVGIALATPQLLAFFEFLPHAWVGSHTGGFAHAGLSPLAVIPSLIAPYVFGPVYAYTGVMPELGLVWGNIGGYAGILLVLLAVYCVIARAETLHWFLLGWIFMALAKTFAVEPAVSVWNVIPMIPDAAFYRYATPSWEFALAVLAACGLEELATPATPRHLPMVITAIVAVSALGGTVAFGVSLWPRMNGVGLRHWAVGSVVWAGITASAFFALALLSRQRWRSVVVASLLVTDSMLFYAIPTLANPRGGDVDIPAIRFLQANLGLQRFYSLGPIAPNYGAYFGIASINFNYAPVDALWSAWVHAHLDATTPPFYLGGGSVSQLRTNVSNYEWIGVKYVVAPADTYPLIETISTRTGTGGNQPLILQPGQSASGKFSAEVVTRAASIDAVGVMLANYRQTATGMLTVSVCSGPSCIDGAIDLATTHDNSVSYIPLRAPFQVRAGAPVRYAFAHQGGSSPMVLWMFPTAEADAQDLVGPDRAVHGMGLQMHLRIASAATHAGNEAFSTQTDRDNSPLVLQPGQSASGTVPSGVISRASLVDAISVNSANYGETATGLLAVTVCSAANCTDGAIDLAQTRDNTMFHIPLRSLLQLHAGAPVRFTFAHRDGTSPMVLWTYGTTKTGEQGLTGPSGAIVNRGLRMALHVATATALLSKPVYSDGLMDIFELPNAAPYFQVVAGSCETREDGRTRITANCTEPSTLLRREMVSDGWTATANGTDVPIRAYHDLFQAIELPRGQNQVSYSYAPRHVNWAWSFMWLGFILLILPGFLGVAGKQKARIRVGPND